MKKIMFNDRYGLTQAVLDGRKTMTRREITYPNAVAMCTNKRYNDVIEDYSRYKVGEIVAVAQRYKDAKVTCLKYMRATDNKGDSYADGFLNKMFVKAELMPHHIRITNIRVERLQDMSDEDCLREGIKQYNDGSDYYFTSHSPKQDFDYRNMFARGCFRTLINLVSGKGTWERNPYVFVYELELVD